MNKLKNLTAERVAPIGVFAILALYPVILTDKYFNITITRYLFFTITSSLFFALCLILKAKDVNMPEKLDGSMISRVSGADVFFTVYVIVSIFSTSFSDYGAAAISGGAGRRMGLLMIISMYFAYLFISKFYRIKEYEFFFFGIVGAFMGLFGMLQYIGLDPLGLLEGLSELDSVRFVSFMGNINIYSSFICIVLPLAMYMFCFSEKKKSGFWLFVVSATFIGFMTTISDSGYLGLGAALVVLAVLTAKEKKTFQKFFLTVITLLISAGIFDFVWRLFGDPEHPSSVPNDIIKDPKVILAGTVVCAIAIILINFLNITEKAFLYIRRFVIFASVVLVAVCIALVLWVTLTDMEIDPNGVGKYFKFSKTWGNGRGFAWSKLLEIYAELPLHKKLIGTGPDTIAYEMVSRHNEEMYKLFGFYYDNAHNELIQYLVTLGAFGLLSYVCLVGSAVKSSLKAESTISRAMVLPIVAYLAQSLVNISQPMTTPLFFVFLAFTQCRVHENKTEKNSITE